MKRIVIALLLGGMSLWFLGVAPAQAAGKVEFRDPEEHAELDRAPGWVSLVFDTKVDESKAKLVVLNSAGKNMTVDALIVEGTQITTQLQSGLPKGTYTVMWRINGAGGEIVGGSYQFAYGKGTWTSDGKSSWTGEQNQPPVIADPNPNPTGVPDPSATAVPTDGGPTGTATGTASGAEPATGEATPGTVPASGGDSGNWWIWAVGAAAVLVAGGGVFVALRRPGSPGPRHAAQDDGDDPGAPGPQ